MSVKTQRTAAFTIVELLIVIVVIAILAAITIVAYNGIQARARDTQRDTAVRQLKSAIEMYRVDNGVYPSVGTDNTGYAVSTLSTPLVPAYISAIPGSLYQYVRGPVANDSYAIMVMYEAKPACKTGANVSTGWWGSSYPVC